MSFKMLLVFRSSISIPKYKTVPYIGLLANKLATLSNIGDVREYIRTKIPIIVADLAPKKACFCQVPSLAPYNGPLDGR